MSRAFILSVLFILIFNGIVLSGPGDTTIVQTFKFSDITKRRGWYVFPSDTMRWHKILMYYTLKCDPATTQDQYPCGEWDYTTYTDLYNYSNISYPYYINNGSAPDSFLLTSVPVYSYYHNYQHYIIYDNVISENDYLIGTGIEALHHSLQSSLPESKSQYIWTAAELITAGLDSGKIDQLKLDFTSVGQEISKLKIRMKNSSLNELTSTVFESDSFVTVYNQNTTIASAGIHAFNFTEPFIWDGSSNLVVDFSFSDNSAGLNHTVNGEITGFNSGIYSLHDDGFISFHQPEYVEVPAQAFAGIDSFITISFWQYGDPLLQPSNSYIFEGKDQLNQRVINCHLPWSNSNIYWDAGNSGGASYDRINKAANYEDFAGKWNHWTFTKNTLSGMMNIYLNGNLWHTGTGMTKTMGGITGFRIASPANSNGLYDGWVNDFRIWNAELDSATIKDWMMKDVDPSHPFYSQLAGYYKFDDHAGFIATDHSGNNLNTTLMGLPEWKKLKGEELFRNIQQTHERPNITFVRGQYNSHLDSVLVVDSVLHSQISVTQNQPYIDTAIAGMSFYVLDTIYAWEAGYTYIYNSENQIIDSLFIPYDTVLRNYYKSHAFQLQNYVTPYGINLDLGPNGFRWVYDVSDYEPLFHDTVEIAAGNQQELIDLAFVMIEGTPPRDPVNVNSIWLGDYGHANICDDVQLPAVDVPLNPSASQYMLRTRTTGHWFGGFENCAEFCPKYHNLKINGVQEFEWLNWTECAMNPVYPQGGTWIYDRAGWCPGSFADTYDWEITDLVNPGDTVSVDYGIEPYPSGGGEGNFRITVQLFEYNSPNFTNDAAVTEIISPNKWEFRKRFNPICGRPEIEIQNTGSSDLNSLQIDYGLEGSADYSYNWTGNLGYLEKERVFLPAVDFDYFLNDSLKFQVILSSPNGIADEYEFNNIMSSEFEAPDLYYSDGIIIAFRTNNVSSENRYELKDAGGNIIFQRSTFQNALLHIDTVFLSEGCYDFTLFDSDDDGISFWNHPADGSGWLKINLLNGTTVLNLEKDFGKQTSHRFSLADNSDIAENTLTGKIRVFPNPADKELNISIVQKRGCDINIELTDIYGKLLYSSLHKNVLEKTIKTDVSSIASGVYYVKIRSNEIYRVEKIVIE